MDELILRSERFGPYELGDAILARDYRKSVQVAGAMLDDGAEPLWVLSQIVRVWRQLFIGKGLANQRSAKEVAAAVGFPHSRPANLSPAAENMNGNNLLWGFEKFSIWIEL